MKMRGKKIKGKVEEKDDEENSIYFPKALELSLSLSPSLLFINLITNRQKMRVCVSLLLRRYFHRTENRNQYVY
jgi:hypothetical protein